MIPSSHLPHAADSIRVGARLRAIRKERGLTIRALAKQCALSMNTLSLIENEHTSPSVHTLQNMARGLQVPISVFFESEVREHGAVYQKQGQRTVTRFTNGLLEDLGEGLPPLGAEPILITLESTHEDTNDVNHAGREFVYCLEGCVTCMVADKAYELSVGDSLLFEARAPHRWINANPQPSRLLVLFCPMEAGERPAEQHLGH